MIIDVNSATYDWESLTSLAIATGAAVASFIAIRYAKRAADASERQAKASEAQAAAIPAQLAAAQDAASAARQQADIALQTANEAKRSAQLSVAQMKASLQPILTFERRPPDLRDPIDFIVNTGDGVAVNITARYATNIPPAEIQAPNMLAANKDAKTRVDWSRTKIEAICILYESQDGRKFRTLVGVDAFWHPTHLHEELPSSR
jgi:hypothetical protein